MTTDSTTASSASGAAASSGAFSALRHSTFAVLWTATVLGNTGSFMRDVASSWMVTELSASPAAVAAIQAAATLPIFLFAIPAGVLADILDRRRFLIAVQLMLAAVSGTLIVLSHTGTLTVGSLIALTFIGGIGAALVAPAWQSIVPELVPRAELKGAVALNSLGINIARAIGPAAGGLILATLGAAVTYGADVTSYVFVISALLWWKRPVSVQDELSESFLGAFRAGMRYTRNSRPLHIVLLRTGVFFLFASSVWALLPLVARNMLGGSAGFYGVLLGAVGVGAIGGAFLLPMLRQRLGSDGLILLASLITAVVMLGLVAAPPRWVAVLSMVLLGTGWIMALTTLNGVAQSILPNWVRGRGLAVYITVFNGAMAAGSVCWGLVASEIGLPATLAAGAVGLALIAAVFHRIELPSGEDDLQASLHWPQPTVAEPIANDRGPVLVQIEYRIKASDRASFLAALGPVAEERRRDGAYAWGVSEHTGDPERVIEWFFVESWAEHLRQHARISHADADLQGQAVVFHLGPEKPVVDHFLSMDPRGTPR